MFDIQDIPNVSGFALQPPWVLLAPDGLLLLLLPSRLGWTPLPGEVKCQQKNITDMNYTKSGKIVSRIRKTPTPAPAPKAGLDNTARRGEVSTKKYH